MSNHTALGLRDANNKVSIRPVDGLVNIRFCDLGADINLNNSIRTTDGPSQINQFDTQVWPFVILQGIPFAASRCAVQFVKPHMLPTGDRGACMHCQGNVRYSEVGDSGFGICSQLRDDIPVQIALKRERAPCIKDPAFVKGRCIHEHLVEPIGCRDRVYVAEESGILKGLVANSDEFGRRINFGQRDQQ
ncbi:hypothetical protein LMG28614_04122 [Paraburkholderia ultramafica]|uniref:Uncharacterized protein n=1 Tax=Paraburkholderia ultramafica TaxID=1544867 RepID=A0A6S7BC36_9BURK|nr:hypothetical protein LMG28614_04122 [Paraburkholderia ultramafica]